MKKQLLVVIALLTLSAFSPQTAPAQLPGGLKIPKVGKPKPTPRPRRPRLRTRRAPPHSRRRLRGRAESPS